MRLRIGECGQEKHLLEHPLLGSKRSTGPGTVQHTVRDPDILTLLPHLTVSKMQGGSSLVDLLSFQNYSIRAT